MILAACHRPEFHSSPPSQIVPALADQGIYVASESSFYRVLHEADEQHDRGRARKRRKRAKPTAYTATGPNQCWCWDVVRHEALLTVPRWKTVAARLSQQSGISWGQSAS